MKLKSLAEDKKAHKALMCDVRARHFLRYLRCYIAREFIIIIEITRLFVKCARHVGAGETMRERARREKAEAAALAQR
jgi:hypothetical protein